VHGKLPWIFFAFCEIAQRLEKFFTPCYIHEKHKLEVFREI